MNVRFLNNERPGMWGFFVCLTVVGVISVVRVLWTQHIAEQWPRVQAERVQTIEEVCNRDFETRARGLLGIAASIADDTTLFQNLFQTDPASVQSAFDELRSKRHSDNLTFEITDARGAILCWSGKSADSSYEDELRATRNDTIVSLSPRGLYTYLSVGLSAARKRAYVFVSHPLVVNYPISNRFVRSTNFTDNLRALVKTDFRLTSGPDSTPQGNGDYQTAVLRDFAGIPVGQILFAKPRLDAVLQEVNNGLDRWLTLFVGLASLCLAWAAFLMSRRISRTWLRTLVVIAGLWGVRFLWIVAEFPARIVGGSLFNPSMYSSPFLLGAASSLGETLVSLLVLAWTIVLCCRPVYESLHRENGWFSSLVQKSLTLRSAVIVGLIIAVLWSARGFGAVLRSFVVDSTIAFHDPLTTFPSFTIFIMQVNILVFGVTFAGFVLLLSFLQVGIADSFSKAGRKVAPFLLPALFFFTFIAFQLLNPEPIIPWYISLIILLAGYDVAGRLSSLNYDQLKIRATHWRGLSVLIVVSSILSLVVTDREIHAKEREQVQAYAQELLQPLDSWISFVLTDGLRSIVNSYQQQPLANGLPNENNGNLAFLFWTRTLMSREGYNSAVVVYNALNKEISSFSVGLSSYEQREILSKVFDNEEESVVVLDRTSPLGASKSYGLWSTIRSDKGTLLGSVALLLSASEKSMFGGDENETLLSSRNSILQNVYRPTTVSIFENGRLTATTHEELALENDVPQVVTDRFAEGSVNKFWMNEVIGGKDYESLFARDPGAPGKVVEVSLEAIDYRWHIFDFLKLLSAALASLVLLALARGAKFLTTQHRIALPFRTKLLVSFLVLGFVPLILLGYYNKEFAAQSLDEAITKTLIRDLDIISQRILSSVSDEEDYLKGVNNDFAESVASDLGVDFTVYHRTEVQASSRPELYQASILDSRLPGNVFAEVVLTGKQFVIDEETIGSVRYAVGYRPLYLHGNFVGVLAVPAPYHQRDIEEGLARRNAYYAAVYAIMIIIIMSAGWGIARQLSIPVRELTSAAREIGKGNLDVHVVQRSNDEIGELVKSFDQMAVEIKTSRINLAAAERKLAWTEMAKQVAHEIKNPLTPMKLSIQHLRQAFKDKAKDLPGIVDRTTQMIIEQIDALSRIAAEFSQYARMPEKRFERISVDETVLECVELFNTIKGIEFRVKFDDNNSQLIADKDELRRVFINIIRNSVQAMDRDGTITIESHLAAGSCRLRFSDSGEGIPAKLLSKVFEPNFSTKTDGTGLGLAISQKIIQDLNGTIGITSSAGKGTTVEISLPV
jgi:two-component system, NtrC family, nitrogen regulation sensor histidine kinase NtrY